MISHFIIEITGWFKTISAILLYICIFWFSDSSLTNAYELNVLSYKMVMTYEDMLAIRYGLWLLLQIAYKRACFFLNYPFGIELCMMVPTISSAIPHDYG